MSTLTKFALGVMAQLRPRPAAGEGRAAIADALGLTHDQQVLLSQTVGYPKT